MPQPLCSISAIAARNCVPQSHLRLPSRSEEHTSELQSLMRISYAVFCLKKKKKKPKEKSKSNNKDQIPVNVTVHIETRTKLQAYREATQHTIIILEANKL